MTPKEQGIEKVVNNNQSDHKRILEYAVNWIQNRFRPFTADDMRNDFEAEHDPPRQPKIYGGVFNTLFKQDLIKQNGTTTSKRPQAHGRLIRQWISYPYSMQQSTNRKADTGQIPLELSAS